MHTLVFGLRGGGLRLSCSPSGKEDDTVYNFIYEALSEVIENKLGLNEWLGLVLKCGEINLKAWSFDAANTETYGHPVPTEVPLGAKSERPYSSQGTTSRTSRRSSNRLRARDLRLYAWRNAPTRLPGPEEIPAFLRPLRDRLAEPASEFAVFPGSIVMTTNCIQKPLDLVQGQYFHRRPPSAGRALST